VEKLQATGWIAKWATELKPYDIKYEPKTIIKGQVLADFIAEFTLEAQRKATTWKGGSSMWMELQTTKVPVSALSWQLRKGPSLSSFTLGFPVTNNETEYEAVIAGLRMVALLVMSQVNGEYEAKDEWMAAYMQLVLSLSPSFLDMTLNKSLGRKTTTLTPWLIWHRPWNTNSEGRSLSSTLQSLASSDQEAKYSAWTPPRVERSHHCLPEGWGAAQR